MWLQKLFTLERYRLHANYQSVSLQAIRPLPRFPPSIPASWRRRWHRREIHIPYRLQIPSTKQELSPGPGGQSGRMTGDSEESWAYHVQTGPTRPLLVRITAAKRRLIAIVRSAIKQELHAKLTEISAAQCQRAAVQRQTDWQDAQRRCEGMEIDR